MKLRLTYKLEDETYQQYVLDERDEKVLIGIPLKLFMI
jgi:hypothetical protein